MQFKINSSGDVVADLCHTVLYNIVTGNTEGEIREGTFNGIWNSALSTEPGWTPEHIVELTVTENDKPEYNPETQRIRSEWEVDLEAETYTKVWTVENKTQQVIDYEKALADWKYPQWAKRIVAPVSLATDDIGIKMFVWFTLNGFPVEKANETTAHLYCNIILPDHQNMIDSLEELVFVENIPEILSP